MTAGHLLLAGGLSIYMLIAIRYEERDLTGLFGDDYRRYRVERRRCSCPRFGATRRLEAQAEPHRSALVVGQAGDVAGLAAIEEVAAEPAVAAEQLEPVAQLGVDLAPARA